MNEEEAMKAYKKFLGEIDAAYKRHHRSTRLIIFLDRICTAGMIIGTMVFIGAIGYTYWVSN